MHERRNKHERGQSLVEFALSLPILIIILSGLIDIGRVYFAYIFLEEAAAEASLYISMNPNCIEVNGLPECDDPNNALWRARNSGSTQGIVQSGTLFLEASTTGGATEPGIGDTVYVDATLDFNFVTPFIQALMENIDPGSNGVLQLKVTSSHLVITE